MVNWQDARTWSVLLVEDELDNREVISETLIYFGVFVRTAENGMDALRVLEEFTPDLILLDLSMPKMDGWEMRKRVKSDPRFANIPIIALTAHAMAGDKEHALDVGFDGYITKPISIATLVQNIREPLELRSVLAAVQAPVDTVSASGNGKEAHL
ncbi:MAG TPA: response regulator [Aggregatilineaceae bacterium]|nr:response regulator [Aggregatilineaceae bacterium]